MIELMTKTQFKDLFEIMDYSFPRNERRDMDEQLALFDDGRYKVACQYGDDGKLRAFMAYWELDGVTYLEHFAVARTLRGAGLGGAFLDELLKGLKPPVCLEVELPETDIAARRIAFYRRHGFILNDYDYIQPPLGKGRVPQPLKVMSYGAPLSRGQFEDIRGKIYAAVYKADIEDYR